jgi:hypothetical protein
MPPYGAVYVPVWLAPLRRITVSASSPGAKDAIIAKIERASILRIIERYPPEKLSI